MESNVEQASETDTGQAMGMSPMAAMRKQMNETKAGQAMGMCPMAAMCKGMSDTSAPGFLMMIPGLLLVLGGVLVLLEPAVLVWLMGGTSILIGVVLLAMAVFVRTWARRLRPPP